MSEGKNVPKIRFPGFDGEWQCCKLSNLLSLSNDRNDGKYTRNDVLAASLGTELEKKHLFFGLKATDESVKNYRIVRNGDVIFTKSPIKGFPNGIIRANKGEDGIVPSLYCVYHSNINVNPAFIQALFEDKSRLDEYLFPLVNTGARNNVNITDKGFLEGFVCIPSIVEQNKIEELLETVTNQIILLQQDLDKWKELKKGLLQRMFPKEEENVPEIRFPEFSGEWGQACIGEITNVLSASRVHKEEWRSEGIPFYRSSDVVAAYKGIENSKAFIPTSLYDNLIKSSGVLEQGDILITGGGSIGIPYIVPNNDPLYSKDADLIWIKKSVKHNSKFLYFYILSPVFREYLNSISHVGTIAHYTIEQVKASPIKLPNTDEQIAIGNCFEKIDQILRKSQRELDKWKELKKGLLQQMFV